MRLDTAVIDIPKRRQKRISYLEQTVSLAEYDGELRQIAAQGLGRAQPALFLTNNFQVSARQVIMDYARRNGIEDGLGTNVNFFHLDCLSSEVRLNVDLDVTLTVIANGCYCWLARQPKASTRPSPSNCTASLWKPLDRSKSSPRVVCTSDLIDEVIIRFSARRHWTKIVRPSPGSRIVGSNFSTPDVPERARQSQKCQLVSLKRQPAMLRRARSARWHPPAVQWPLGQTPLCRP